MNFLKKINKLNYLLIAFIVFSIHIVTTNTDVSAKTVRDLKNELAEKKQEAENNQNARRRTEAEMAAVYTRIGEITEEKAAIEEEVVRLNNEIVELNQAIIDKNEEIKNIINYYQLSATGEAAYMEYLFKSKDFTDFIYRLAVAEQLSQYNEDLIKEYNDLITKNEQTKEELAQRQIDLSAKQEELRNELSGLSANLSDLLDANVDIEDEIAALEEYIDIYQNQFNCADDDDIDYCTRDQLPPGTAAFRPTDYGYVTADYGWYYPWGYAMWHYGMDIGGNHHAPVYSIANGRVAAVYYHQSCGGNMVFIQHIINGMAMTSGYLHLASVNVSVGDSVTYNTQIGTVGGSPSSEYWDSCSTGAHLHVQTSYGLMMQDYSDLGSFNAYAFDPRYYVNFPGEGGYYSDRTTRY
ncbi:MAG: peptidoglycan DD-metalloendopeptidase family protein [Bacilli bacterium]|nr:peptidoglycan DD-metalloendopeptidase family protein [Bacilli bacterium]